MYPKKDPINNFNIHCYPILLRKKKSGKILKNYLHQTEIILFYLFLSLMKKNFNPEIVGKEAF